MTYVSELRNLVGHRPLLLAAAGVVVVDDLGRWLLQRRVDDGLWGLLGGALELGESFEDAARRELFEERVAWPSSRYINSTCTRVPNFSSRIPMETGLRRGCDVPGRSRSWHCCG